MTSMGLFFTSTGDSAGAEVAAPGITFCCGRCEPHEASMHTPNRPVALLTLNSARLVHGRPVAPDSSRVATTQLPFSDGDVPVELSAAETEAAWFTEAAEAAEEAEFARLDKVERKALAPRPPSSVRVRRCPTKTSPLPPRAFSHRRPHCL